MKNVSAGNEQLITKKRVFTAKATAISEGDAFCYDSDSAVDPRGNTQAVTVEGTGRYQIVEPPSITNMGNFAGFAANSYVANAAGQWIDIVVPIMGASFNVRARVNCTVNVTVMGVIPGTPVLRAGCIFPESGFAFLAIQTVDRSTTAGLVQIRVIPADSPLVQAMSVNYFDDFLEGGYVHTVHGQKFTEVANAGEWFVTVIDSHGPDNAETLIVDDTVGGILTITTNVTAADEVNAAMEGESFMMAVGYPLRFEALIAEIDILKDHLFIGLTESATTAYAAPGNNHVGFRNDNDGNIDYTSDTAGAATAADTLVNMANGVFNKVAFVWDGVNALRIYVDNVLKATLSTEALLASVDAIAGETVTQSASICVDAAMTPTICVAAAGAAAAAVKIDYLRVNGTRAAV